MKTMFYIKNVGNAKRRRRILRCTICKLIAIFFSLNMDCLYKSYLWDFVYALIFAAYLIVFGVHIQLTLTL